MKVWIYLDGRQQGPYELEELLDMPVDQNTKVWFEGLPKWYPAGALPQMRPLFDGTLVRGEKNIEAQVEVFEDEPVPGLENEQDNTSGAVEESARTTESPYAPGRKIDRRNRPDEPCPPTYLGLSIGLTVCCCSPVSLAALIASLIVTSQYNNGKLDKARKTSEIAAWLVMIAIALGFFPVMLMSLYTQG